MISKNYEVITRNGTFHDVDVNHAATFARCDKIDGTDKVGIEQASCDWTFIPIFLPKTRKCLRIFCSI
ncbi:unnamed protein product [Onchocerca flexuosa]|uniref:Phage protein n=1 Tax=Onchocerca flexuosa TaxID=387005 RepID=A0A183HZ20_9BILA|nr:unnamed protein product [Onchocerca flexuosa]